MYHHNTCCKHLTAYCDCNICSFGQCDSRNQCVEWVRSELANGNTFGLEDTYSDYEEEDNINGGTTGVSKTSTS
jgi:hypothetical protein